MRRGTKALRSGRPGPAPGQPAHRLGQGLDDPDLDLGVVVEYLEHPRVPDLNRVACHERRPDRVLKHPLATPVRHVVDRVEMEIQPLGGGDIRHPVQGGRQRVLDLLDGLDGALKVVRRDDPDQPQEQVASLVRELKWHGPLLTPPPPPWPNDQAQLRALKRAEDAKYNRGEKETPKAPLGGRGASAAKRGPCGAAMAARGRNTLLVNGSDLLGGGARETLPRRGSLSWPRVGLRQQPTLGLQRHAHNGRAHDP